MAEVNFFLGIGANLHVSMAWRLNFNPVSLNRIWAMDCLVEFIKNYDSALCQTHEPLDYTRTDLIQSLLEKDWLDCVGKCLITNQPIIHMIFACKIMFQLD